MHDSIYIRGSQTDYLCVYILIVERLVDGILGVKREIAAFVIQFLECYYNSATCCYLVDKSIPKNNFELIAGSLGEEFANYVNLEMMPLKCQLKKHFPVFDLFKLCRQNLHNRLRKKTISSLYQVGVRAKYAQHEKHFNITKRHIQRWIRVTYYWYNTRSLWYILFVLQPS